MCKMIGYHSTYTGLTYILGGICIADQNTRGATVTGCVPRGFISMISKVKKQQKIQKDWNSKTLTFALIFCMCHYCGRGRLGYSNSSSALKCRRAKNPWGKGERIYHLTGYRSTEASVHYTVQEAWKQLSIELHFVCVHGPYELHRKIKQIKCTT